MKSYLKLVYMVAARKLIRKFAGMVDTIYVIEENSLGEDSLRS